MSVMHMLIHAFATVTLGIFPTLPGSKLSAQFRYGYAFNSLLSRMKVDDGGQG